MSAPIAQIEGECTKNPSRSLLGFGRLGSCAATFAARPFGEIDGGCQNQPWRVRSDSALFGDSIFKLFPRRRIVPLLRLR